MKKYQHECHSSERADERYKQFGRGSLLDATVAAYKAGGPNDHRETKIELGVGSCSHVTIEAMKLHVAYINEAIAYAESDELQEWLKRPVSAEADKGNSTE
jgi:hypothetical protein